VVSFIAEPTPALPSGTADMIDPVIDGIVALVDSRLEANRKKAAAA
jgi:hypothetical protein